MSRFDERFAATALPGLIDQMGTVVTYRPAGGDDVSLTAVVGAEDADETIDDDRGRTVPRTRRAWVALDPASAFGGVAAPGIDDRVVIDSVVWDVDAVKLTGSTAELRLVNNAAAGRNRPGYFNGRG